MNDIVMPASAADVRHPGILLSLWEEENNYKRPCSGVHWSVICMFFLGLVEPVASRPLNGFAI